MLIFFVAGTFIVTLFIAIRLREKIRVSDSIAFFHPHCEGGGGGERVLYQAIVSLLKFHSGTRRFRRIIIYARETSSTEQQIIDNVRERFNISLFTEGSDVVIEFVRLRGVWLMNPQNFPHFTLLLQCIMDFVVGCEAMSKFLPAYFIDTTGCPFTLPLFRWIGGCRVACYVHYPTITSRMISRVKDGEAMYNNSDVIAKNTILMNGKLLYYRLFSVLYWVCGFAADVIMTNGSWTDNHIKNLWGRSTFKVFPPVELKLSTLAYKRSLKPIQILSVGQIRPEKNHQLQLEVLRKLLDMALNVDVQLCIAGGCRNADDECRVNRLKDYAREIGVDDHVKWELNVSVERLIELNQMSLVGIHTMMEEHFGIAVVESMAAGVIMVAHDSGGPKEDIIDPDVTGFLATTADEYAVCIADIINMGESERAEMIAAAQKSAERFSTKAFEESFMHALSDL